MTVDSQLKQTTASLKGVKATLDLYVSQSSTAHEKDIFKRNSLVLQNVIDSLEKRIGTLEYEENENNTKGTSPKTKNEI
ncbi:DUF1657 domain-containing protein [Ammoniphilus sp. 3BR4]|uniref:DUF1657 domain-containing protein n=1 Tax=Ammoniphilus sp. 3BR4 TaxID=3158265 RepID=UPI0034653AA5